MGGSFKTFVYSASGGLLNPGGDNGPQKPDPPQAPAQATTQDPEAVDRQTKEKQRLAAMAGRGSTILTTQGSLGTPTGTGKTLLGS